jgi:hypothetical protein
MIACLVLSWLGFAVLSTAFFSVALALDSPRWPATQCQAKWANAHLTTRWRWGTWCTVYADGAWVPDADIHFRSNLNQEATAD